MNDKIKQNLNNRNYTGINLMHYHIRTKKTNIMKILILYTYIYICRRFSDINRHNTK